MQNIDLKKKTNIKVGQYGGNSEELRRGKEGKGENDRSTLYAHIKRS
jgi:hypothetical protein